MRVDGYAPIRDYAAIGDGRTVALIARDGAIDWLCLPNLDSPSAFGALVDAERGGRFELEPEIPYTVGRRYVPGTNVLETTFETPAGRVQVTDALTLPAGGLTPYRELVRRIDGLAGEVPMRWSATARPEYGAARSRIAWRAGVPVLAHRQNALAFIGWDAGTATSRDNAVEARFVASQGKRSHLVLSASCQEPLVFPARADVDARLEATTRRWRAWTDERDYDGPFREAVLRSALALKLLVFAPSGAIAAAATTSLPEEIGGERNWDYRLSWPRDAAFTLQALLALGCADEARAFFSWLLHASQLTHPRMHVLYRLDGGTDADERELGLAGYRGSRPVRVGNAAARQTQLDVYGEVLGGAAVLADAVGGLDRDHARRLAGIANLVCDVWRNPDAGIWETRGAPGQFTQSKMMCAVALDRAVELAAQGHLPTRDAARWRREAGRIREFVESRCYSDSAGRYRRSAEDDGPDASLLLAVLAGYDRADAPRQIATVDAIRRELGSGSLVHRYVGEPGAFLACSFWLAEAYARQGRLDEAAALLDALVPLANDVGLFAEEIDPASGDFLGNFPQGLTHLALINAAVAVAERSA